jgi:outer membrane protein
MHYILLLITIFSIELGAQGPRRLTLAEVVELAKKQSIAARQAETTRETRYWQYKAFQSDFRPQLVLNGSLPSFNRAFREVWQPNGTVLFQPVRNNNSSLSLALQQNIARTGGTIFATTQLQRFDDFDRNVTLYNGAPLTAVGFDQPLFRFNTMKWDNKIEPLKYQESRREYIESIEQICQNACNLYFDLLLAQVNFSIAETNLKTTIDILKIANEKYELGKTSRNELLQLQLEQLKAQKALAAAQRDVEVAGLSLRSYSGLQGDEKLVLEETKPQNPPDVDAEMLLTEALANRADAIAFSRRKLEAERGVAKAKGDNGVNLTLSANLGVSNSSVDLEGVLRNPQDYQAVRLQLDVPILDWGRSKSRIKTAQANRQLTEYAIQQDQQTFRQEIITAVSLYQLLKNQLELNVQTDRIAQEQYDIARERYVLGNLNVTDLSLSFAEKDRAKRDYIGALRDYWTSYFNLRQLTLFDFDKKQRLGE